MISILAAMAQMERERLAERVKSGMIQIAKKEDGLVVNVL